MKTINKLLTVFTLLSLFFAGTPTQSAHAAGVRYAIESGAGDCSAWDNACTLQTALTGADSGDQIWVAAGTHKPGTLRADTFQLKNGVEVYGGFPATGSPGMGDRDPAANLTILSGDLNGDDIGFANNGENSFHVLVGSGTDSTAVLDGFTVAGGKANGSFPQNVGGGMYNYGGSPTLTNVTFSGNYAVYGGGMLNNNSSSPTLTNVTFSGNLATTGGGGLYNWVNSSPTLTNATFSGNLATTGGGMFNDNSSPTLTNVTISGNSASGSGGGMFNNNNSSPTLTNVIIANSLSGGDCVNDALITLNAASSNNLIEDSDNACGLTNGSADNIIGQDPNLGPLTGTPAYFRLLSGSPAIDTGANSGCPATDQRGMARPQGSQCDIGAYEYEEGIYTYTVTFNTNGGSGSMAPQSGEYDTTAALTSNTFTRDGYTFNGWNTQADGSGTAYADGANYTFVADLTLYAQWLQTAPAAFGKTAPADGTTDVPLSPTLTWQSSTGAASYQYCLGTTSGTCDLADWTDVGDETSAFPGGLEANATYYWQARAVNQGGNIEADGGTWWSFTTVSSVPGSVQAVSIASQDGWILKKTVGGKVNRGAETLRIGDSAKNRQYRSILSFDTSGIPENAVITSITLEFKYAGKIGTLPFGSHGNLLVDIRGGAFSNNVNLQAADFSAIASKVRALVFKANDRDDQNWYRKEMNPDYFKFINRDGLTQFRLRFAMAHNNNFKADFLSIFSGDAIDEANRPQLIIEYYVP